MSALGADQPEEEYTEEAAAVSQLDKQSVSYTVTTENEEKAVKNREEERKIEEIVEAVVKGQYMVPRKPMKTPPDNYKCMRGSRPICQSKACKQCTKLCVFGCDRCEKRFTSLKNLRHHCFMSHNGRFSKRMLHLREMLEVEKKCPICKRSFSDTYLRVNFTDAKFSEHLAEAHADFVGDVTSFVVMSDDQEKEKEVENTMQHMDTQVFGSRESPAVAADAVAINTSSRISSTVVRARRRGRPRSGHCKAENLAAENGLPATAAAIIEMSLTDLHLLLKSDGLSEHQKKLIRKIRHRGKDRITRNAAYEQRVIKLTEERKAVDYLTVKVVTEALVQQMEADWEAPDSLLPLDAVVADPQEGVEIKQDMDGEQILAEVFGPPERPTVKEEMYGDQLITEVFGPPESPTHAAQIVKEEVDEDGDTDLFRSGVQDVKEECGEELLADREEDLAENTSLTEVKEEVEEGGEYFY